MRPLTYRDLAFAVGLGLLPLLPGCQVIGGIFKAGVWVGILAVLGVALLVGVTMAAMSRRS